jgi:NAD(P)-dependent dehydrogenase (short-subunit alcohol dehydrogenase family)
MAETDRFLAGKTALVTSASRNLGAAIAGALASCGASVAVNYLQSEEAARALVSRLPGDGHVAVPGDTTTGEGVRQLVGDALEALGGRVDVLVNNSGPFSMTPFAELPEPEWDRIMNANVRAAYLATQLVAPGMRAQGWGRIVNVSAVSTKLRNHSIYGLAKQAMNALTEELAVELGPEITVNAVEPGQILESADDIAAFDPTFVPRAIAATPAGRLVTRAEVARVVALLTSPAFDMVTGAILPIDGGFRFYRF